MFIRIGIGKFILDFGDRRKDKDRRARHFIMDDEDRKADEERRKDRDRRSINPFPESGSSQKDSETSAHYQDKQNKMDEQGHLSKKEKTPRRWRK